MFFFFFVLLQWSLAGIFEISNHWKFVGLFVFCTKFGCRYAFLYLLCARNANTKHFEHTRKIFKKNWVQFFLVFFVILFWFYRVAPDVYSSHGHIRLWFPIPFQFIPIPEFSYSNPIPPFFFRHSLSWMRESERVRAGSHEKPVYSVYVLVPSYIMRMYYKMFYVLYVCMV